MHSSPEIGCRTECRPGMVITLSDQVFIPHSAGVAGRLIRMLSGRLLCPVTATGTFHTPACITPACTWDTIRRCRMTIATATASTAGTWKVPISTRLWNAFTGTWKTRVTGGRSRRTSDPDPGHDHAKGDDLSALTEGGHPVLLCGRRATAHLTDLLTGLLTDLLTGLLTDLLTGRHTGLRPDM